MHEVDEISFFDQSFQPPVDVAYRGNGINNLFIFGHEIEMDRLRKYGMLGSKRDNILMRHGKELLYSFCCSFDFGLLASGYLLGCWWSFRLRLRGLRKLDSSQC